MSVRELEEAESRRATEAKKKIHSLKVVEARKELGDALKANDDSRLVRACSSFFGLMQNHSGRKPKVIPA